MAKAESIHKLTITIRTDKPCTGKEAARIAADCIHGEFFPCVNDTDAGVESFKVKGIKR